MIIEVWNNYQIVEKSLCNERAVDEQTFTSLKVLSERLERLKGLDSAFSEVEFSPAVKQLKEKHNLLAVG